MSIIALSLRLENDILVALLAQNIRVAGHLTTLLVLGCFRLCPLRCHLGVTCGRVPLLLVRNLLKLVPVPRNRIHNFHTFLSL